MACSTCYETKLPACASPVDVKVGLAASTAYRVRIIDKFEKEYFQDVVTDVAGNFELDLDAFPEGLFTPHSGTFNLTILDSSGKAVMLDIFDEEYTCISFSFYESYIPPPYISAVIPDPSEETSQPIAASFFVQQLEYTAAENIAAYEVITSEFKVANSATVADANKVFALSVTTTTTASKGLAVVNGLVINYSWTWTIGDPVYLNGTTLSQTAPLSGFSIEIGIATRADAIEINIGNPTLL